MRRKERSIPRKTDDDGGMVKIARFPSELHEIPDFKGFFFDFDGERTCARTDFSVGGVIRKETVKKFHARPRGGTIGRGTVKPTENGSKIHHAAAREQALRGEVGTIPAKTAKIVVIRVTGVRPFTGVSDHGGAVVGKNRHILLYARAEERCRLFLKKLFNAYANGLTRGRKSDTIVIILTKKVERKMVTEVLLNVLIQFLYFVVSVFVVGFLISQINKLFYRTVEQKRGFCYATGVIGTPVHELSHALMCLVFGHKIVEMKLFQIDEETGVLGYVNHSYNPRNVYHRMGNYFIGVAPIVGGTVIIYLIIRFLLPTTYAETSVALNELVVAMEGASFGEMFSSIISAFGQMFAAFFSEAATTWKWWVFIVFAFCIALHMNLSGADIKGATSALPILVLVLIVVNFIVRLIGEGVYSAMVGGMATAGCYLIGVLILSLMLSVLTLLVGLLVRGITGLFKRR